MWTPTKPAQPPHPRKQQPSCPAKRLSFPRRRKNREARKSNIQPTFPTTLAASDSSLMTRRRVPVLYRRYRAGRARTRQSIVRAPLPSTHRIPWPRSIPRCLPRLRRNQGANQRVHIPSPSRQPSASVQCLRLRPLLLLLPRSLRLAQLLLVTIIAGIMTRIHMASGRLITRQIGALLLRRPCHLLMHPLRPLLVLPIHTPM